MYLKMLRAALLSAAAFGSMGGMALAADAPAKPATQAVEDPVVARVNGKELHRSDVLLAFQQLPQQARQMPMDQLYPRVLENLIDSKLIADAGYKEKLQDDKMVKEAMKRAEMRFVGQAYVEKQIQTHMNEGLLKKKYDELVKKMPAEDEVRARHILVKTKAEAEAIIKKIQGGADFAKLASEQTIDKNAAAAGGDLGYFLKGDMVAPFADAAFAMKPGEVSKVPVKTEFGWHVIKVEDRRKRQPPPFEKVRDQVEQAVEQDLAADAVEKLRKSAKVQAFDITGKTPVSLTPPAEPAAKK